jgi:hypothetical protein
MSHSTIEITGRKVAAGIFSRIFNIYVVCNVRIMNILILTHCSGKKDRLNTCKISLIFSLQICHVTAQIVRRWQSPTELRSNCKEKVTGCKYASPVTTVIERHCIEMSSCRCMWVRSPSANDDGEQNWPVRSYSTQVIERLIATLMRWRDKSMHIAGGADNYQCFFSVGGRYYSLLVSRQRHSFGRRSRSRSDKWWLDKSCCRLEATEMCVGATHS